MIGFNKPARSLLLVLRYDAIVFAEEKAGGNRRKHDSDDSIFCDDIARPTEKTLPLRFFFRILSPQQLGPVVKNKGVEISNVSFIKRVFEYRDGIRPIRGKENLSSPS